MRIIMIISVSGGGGGNDNMLLEIGPKQEDGKDDRYILHEDTKKKKMQTNLSNDISLQIFHNTKYTF